MVEFKMDSHGGFYAADTETRLIKEEYRIGPVRVKQKNRAEFEEEHADDLREEEHLRRQDTEYWHDVNAHHAPANFGA